jgi:hypothetical protein
VAESRGGHGDCKRLNHRPELYLLLLTKSLESGTTTTDASNNARKKSKKIVQVEFYARSLKKENNNNLEISLASRQTFHRFFFRLFTTGTFCPAASL